MTCLALYSAKGSPGVTTLACALAAVWPSDRRVVVAECDPSGGDLAARFGLSQRRGMASLVLAQRQGPTNTLGLSDHVQRLPGGIEVLVNPVGAESAGAVDRELGRVGMSGFSDDADLIADCGRLISDAPGQVKLLRSAETVLAVVRPDIGGLVHARALVAGIRSMRDGAEVILITLGPSSFAAREIQELVEVDRIESVPLDSRAAAIFAGEAGTVRSLARSPLVSWARRYVRCRTPQQLAPVSLIEDRQEMPRLGSGSDSFRSRNEDADSLIAEATRGLFDQSANGSGATSGQTE